MELGFTMKYPSDWKVNENDILNRYKVMFRPPTKGAYVAVGITNNVTPKVLACMKTHKNNTTSGMYEGIKYFQGDHKHYSLSGYPAVRIVRIKSYEGPGQPYDVKGMLYGTLVGKVLYCWL